MPILTSFSGTATMALGVASAPVPAVVGIIRVGTHLCARSGVSNSSLTPYSSVLSSEASFAISITEPPPTATMKSAPDALKASMAACACW